MNPCNSKQPPPGTQFYITSRMPPLTPATGTSILKSNATPSSTNSVAQSIVTTTLNSVVESEIGPDSSGNCLINTSKYVTATNYMPVILANQTLISSVDPAQHPTNITPSNVLNHTPFGTVINTTNTNIPLITGNVQKPVVLTTGNTGGSNVTYQVMPTSNTKNNSNPVITASNGTILLTSSQNMPTTGHVAEPIIIRNTPTTARVQTKQQPEQQLPSRQQQQQQQPLQHPQLTTKLNTINSQYSSTDILKQIIVGKSGSGTSSTLAPGTTLLKPAILQNKPIQQQIKKKKLVKNTKIAIPQQQTQNYQLQQKLNNQTIITTTSEKSSQMLATLGMEMVKTPHIAQTVQKLPQVSLLHNSNKKLTTNITETINESAVTVLKNPHEIKVGNLNSEVSLIKKPNISSPTSETSLLKPNQNQIQSELVERRKQKQDLEKTTIINAKYDNQQVVASKDTSESYSLLKSNKDFKINFEKELKPTNTQFEKQTSLLKPKNIVKKSRDSSAINVAASQKLKSPRSQRSNSCNTLLKTPSNGTTPTNTERRHSEPSNIELVTTSSPKNKEQNKLNTKSLKPEEFDMFFEDEEYLESSGEKISVDSEKSPHKKNSPQHEKRRKENIETTVNDDVIKLSVTSDQTETTGKKMEKEHENTSEIINKNIDKITKSSQDSNDANFSEDDDVTILPMDEIEIEQIEIVDDDDHNDEKTNFLPLEEKSLPRNESLLLCNEQILVSSSSSISNNSSDQHSASTFLIKSPKLDQPSTILTSSIKKSTIEPKVLTVAQKDEPQSNGYSSVLDMLSQFNMLNWRERIGTARGTNLKFQLNEFNFIQLYEKSLPNKRIHTAYEKPIYERESSHNRNEHGDPTYYTCRRCNVQGPSVDFLAPEFCSLVCLKRDSRKRRDDSTNLSRKRNRQNQIHNTNRNFSNNKVSNFINNNANIINNPPPLSYIKKPKFRWSSYMNSNFSTMAAPISLFLNPFPTGPNSFTIGMKLEAIDPENCALFCVCTIIDIMGYRLKLSFDGYESAYDFWLNADSMDIFPPGWCTKTNRILQPPKGISTNKFNWGAYLNKEKACAAPRHLFTHLNSSSLVPRNPFNVGMHLEAEDLNDTGKLCVASVADVLDDRIRIHFDGWDDCYDIIVDINSPYIHPCGWHKGRQQLVVPPDCENTIFNWKDYIRSQGNGEAACEELFAPRDPINFKPNMRLEVVDPRNPSLIRPATVVSHKGHRVKLHLDGWPSDYCFWLEDDSPDLHPIGWCDATGHDLEPPPGFQMVKQKMPCPVEGCRGIGNSKKAFMNVHATREGCPYAAENWRVVVEKPQRVRYEDIVRTLPNQNKQTVATHQVSPRLIEQQMVDKIKTLNVLDLLDGFSVPSLKKEKTNETKFSKIKTTTSTASLLSPPVTTSLQQQNNANNNVLDVNLDIAKEFLYDYGPRLQQNYTVWQRNFTFDADKIKRSPLEWSSTDVSAFVNFYLKCHMTATQFNEEDIDGEAFLLLQQQDLTEKLGLKLGPAVKLYTYILQLRSLAITKFKVPYKCVGIIKKDI